MIQLKPANRQGDRRTVSGFRDARQVPHSDQSVAQCHDVRAGIAPFQALRLNLRSPASECRKRTVLFVKHQKTGVIRALGRQAGNEDLRIFFGNPIQQKVRRKHFTRGGDILVYVLRVQETGIQFARELNEFAADLQFRRCRRLQIVYAGKQILDLPLSKTPQRNSMIGRRSQGRQERLPSSDFLVLVSDPDRTESCLEVVRVKLFKRRRSLGQRKLEDWRFQISGGFCARRHSQTCRRDQSRGKAPGQKKSKSTELHFWSAIIVLRLDVTVDAV